MEAFNDGGCVYEVSSAQDADEVRIELSDLYPGRAVHVGTLTELFCLGKEEKGKSGGRVFFNALCLLVSKATSSKPEIPEADRREAGSP